MASSRERDVADAISDLIAEVFVSSKMYAVCLPVSLILMEQLQKFKMNPTLNCGQLTFEGEGRCKEPCLHIWVSVGDRIIDPTLKITKLSGVVYKLSESINDYLTLDLAKFKHHPGDETVTDEESKELMQMYTFLRQSSNMVEEYFKMAPKKLNVIRNVINYKIEQAHLDKGGPLPPETTFSYKDKIYKL